MISRSIELFVCSLHAVFQAQLDVCNINSMRVNEEEVQGVSDTLPPVVKSQLKQKRPISEVLEDVPACSPLYKPLCIPQRPSRPHIPVHIQTPEAFFALFITPAHFQTIAHHTNLNAEAKQAGLSEEERPWHATTGAEIGTFLGVCEGQGVVGVQRVIVQS